MKDTQNKHWANDKSKFGLKMLQKMGWKGEGLGKNQDGLKTHVKVTKRSNQLGLGTEDTGSNNDRIDAYAGLKSWQRTTSNFSDVLASLNQTQSEEVKKMKKHKKKKKKKSSKKSGDNDVAADKSTSGTSFRNIFRKRELKNKDISSMNSKDIALILGTAAKSSTSPKKKKRKKEEVLNEEDDNNSGNKSSSTSSSDDDDDSSNNSNGKKRKKKKHKKEKKAKKQKKEKKRKKKKSKE